MATPTTIIQLINDEIKANGQNEITANVLAPVLIAMVQLWDGIIGNPDDLGTVAKVLVDSINELSTDANSVFKLHSGTDDPNVTPPVGVNLGDFYSRTSGGTPVSYWNYDGTTWIELIDKKKAQGSSAVRTSATATSILDSDDTLIYTGANPADVFTIPTAANSIQRKLTFVNQHTADINLSESFIDYLGNSVTALTLQSETKIQSDGTNWYKI